MIPLAYSHYSTGSWAAHTVTSSLIHRAVWSATGGMSTAAIIVLALLGVGFLAWVNR